MSKINLDEYTYNANEPIWKQFPNLDLDELRKTFKDDSHGLAAEMSYFLRQQGILAACVTFKNGHLFNMQIKNDLTCKIEDCLSHSVILLGNCVLDPLKSSRFLSTIEYIDELYELNDELRVDKTLSDDWVDDDGTQIKLTIDKIKKLCL